MAGNKLTITLTEDQQKQIKGVTGRSVKELNIDVAVGRTQWEGSRRSVRWKSLEGSLEGL